MSQAHVQNQDTILAVHQLSKTYQSFKKEPGLLGGLKALVNRQSIAVPAVRAIDFTIARGEFVGLLGPNGAGKTTTLKMLTGLISPTGGAARAFDRYDTAARLPAYLARIGMVMGQRNQLNPDLPAMDSFRLAQAIYSISEERFQRRLQTCVALFGIEAKLLVPVRKLSLGERMKLEMILAILHEPELLFLDEPTIGLDFNAARQIRHFLAEANRQLGITVVLTSHYTKDIEELCRRVILINHGQLVYDGPLAGVDERIQGRKVVTFTCRAAEEALQLRTVLLNLGEAVRVTPALPVEEQDAEAAAADALQVTFDVSVRQAAAMIAKAMASFGAERIADLKVGERQIDEIFSDIYNKPSVA